MSVLIEALTLVVPKHVLGVSYPGGTEAFCKRLLELEKPPRFVCNLDPKLVNASFFDADHLEPATELLERHGVVPVDDDKFFEFAIVDQQFGPTLPCDWLEWLTVDDGFTCAWHVGTPAGDLAAPEGWTVGQSRELVRSDMRDDKERMFHLATEGRVEVWLDFQTGRIITGLGDADSQEVLSPSRERITGSSAESTSAPGMAMEKTEVVSLFDTVRTAISGRGVTTESVAPTTFITRMRQARGTYDAIFATDEKCCLVFCSLSFPERVTEMRRGAVADAMTRANWEIPLGNFELDFSDGEMRFRVSIDVEGGVLVEQMVFNMVSCAVQYCERYHDALMAVAFGDDDPEAAISLVTSGG